MKYAWIEETVEQEVFEHLEGEEMLDVGDVPFDPPQYYTENVSFDPPQFETVGTGNGSVTGLNRAAIEGEREGNITPQHLVWGMDIEAYEVIDEVFTAKSQAEVDAIRAQREADRIALEQAEEELKILREAYEAEREADPQRGFTPEQIRNYIDNQFASASTNAETIEVIKALLKKIAIYVGGRD